MVEVLLIALAVAVGIALATRIDVEPPRRRGDVARPSHPAAPTAAPPD